MGVLGTAKEVVFPKVANYSLTDTLPQHRNLHRTKRTMSNGRSERRIAKTVKLEVSLLDNPKEKERTLTENVSAHGARVLMQRKLQPLQRAVVTSPNEGVWASASVVYCQRLSENSFAVGLELSSRVDSWSNPY